MSDESAGFMELDGFGDTFDPEVVPAGEYKVRVLNAEVKESKNTPGRKYISAYMEIVGVPTAKDFNHMMLLPNRDLDVDSDGRRDIKKVNQYLSDIKNFCIAFDIPYGDDGFDLFVAKGRSTWALLKVIPAKGEYPEANGIAKWLPKR